MLIGGCWGANTKVRTEIIILNNMDINLELRSEILECSLHMEKEVNNLILLFLGINPDNRKIKVFGNKSGNISFRNKIDLLTDLKVLSDEENFDFNLLMEYRNKFLHVADCNSFKNAFELLGSGQKSKLTKFIEEGGSIDNEKDCLSAFKSLFLKNLRVLLDKIESKKRIIAFKAEIIDNFKEQSLLHVDFFFDLIKEIKEKFDSIDLSDGKVQHVVKEISSTCKKYADKYSSDDKFLLLKERQQELMANPDFLKEYWNVVDLKNQISDIENKND